MDHEKTNHEESQNENHEENHEEASKEIDAALTGDLAEINPRRSPTKSAGTAVAHGHRRAAPQDAQRR